MVGREDALKSLQTMVMSRSTAGCAIISDLLGAGKSFLVQHAFAQMAKDKVLDEERDVANLFVDEVTDNSILEGVAARIAVVDELDRKARRPALEDAVRTLCNWISGDRVAILIGDFSLKDADLMKGLVEKVSLNYIKLDPLDRSLLCEAIRQRLFHWLCQPPSNMEKPQAEEEANEAVSEMFAPELLDALLPHTKPQVATFREVLGLLQKMAEYLKLDTNPCCFTVDTYLDWIKHSPPSQQRNEKQAKFIEELHYEIRDRACRDEAWGSMDVSEWPWVSNLTMDKRAEYETEVLEPLARAQVLLPMGIPYSGPSRKRLVGPYLPTVQTFLAALLGSK